MNHQTLVNSAIFQIITKISLLILVLGLLIGHGTDIPDKGYYPDLSPCESLAAAPDHPIPMPFCIDNVDSAGDISQLDGLTVLDAGLYILMTDLSNLDFLAAITEIKGSLHISSNTQLTRITSVETQLSLQKVEDLWLSSNTALTDLQGFSNLNSVAGNTYIYNNSKITSLGGMRLGAEVANVTIQNNAMLTDVAALQNTVIAAELLISQNALLNYQDLSSLTTSSALSLVENNVSSLSGLSNLQNAGNLWIASDKLTNFNGLNPQVNFTGLTVSGQVLTTLNGLSNGSSSLSKLSVRQSPALGDLSALANVTSITGDLDISGDSSLTSLQGLENLINIGGRLIIGGNDALISTAALANVISVGSLNIDRNPLLIELGMTGLSRVDQNFTISNNASLCETSIDSAIETADTLLQQILSRDGIGVTGNTTVGINISGNRVCQ